MELSNLITIYGKPVTMVCPSCGGKGCEVCRSFGYIARTRNNEVTYIFNYPMYIDLQKRNEMNYIRNISLLGLTGAMILSIIISYIINITNAH